MFESLDPKIEKETGKELYNDLLRWKELQLGDFFKAEIKQVNNRKEFFDALNQIKHDCKNNSIYPMIHFEIHGNERGFYLVSKELVKWTELYEHLIKINLTIGNNLFITLAVCKGAYLMELIKPINPAPFWGFIGSFEKIQVGDILIRYNEFYLELLESFNVFKAFKKLQDANSEFPSTYRFINSEETFKRVYDKYIAQETSTEGLKQRVKNVQVENNLNFINRVEKRKFEREFKKQVLKTKNYYYKKHSDIFFMLDEFPENRTRFNVEDSPY